MTNIDHTAETLYNGTVYHNYIGGPFEMEVFDRRASDNSNPSYIRLSIKRHAYINVGVTERPFLDEPDYLIETRTSSRDCDLETLIEDAAIARDVIHAFREILLNDHQITTSLNGK
ncbi:hypothetical protein [Corynebacterium variabile]|nr:hypothetical protein [Corynebacterium variabile]